MITNLTTEPKSLSVAASQDAHPVVHPVTSTLQALWRMVSAPVRLWLKRERAYRELMMLDDRTLADIGLHRTDIMMVVQAVGRDVDPRIALNQNKPHKAA